MYTSTVVFRSVNDAREFADICTMMPFRVELICGIYTIDAKSLMGLFSLDLSKEIELHADCAPDHPFVGKIARFVVPAVPAEE